MKLKKLWQHHIFISVAFSETGRMRDVRLRTSAMVLVIAALFASTLLGAGVFGFKLRQQADLAPKVKAYEQRIAKLEEQKAYHEQQFKIMAQEMGVLQAKMDRFDMIGERLFSDHTISEHLSGMPGVDGAGSAEVPELPKQAPDINELKDQISTLSKRSHNVEEAMQAGLKLLASKRSTHYSQPYLWPVVNHRTYRTSPYGYRTDPFSGRKRWHSGVDIGGGYNAPIVASGNGLVVFSGYRYGYGFLVEIRHPGGFTTRYAHLNKVLAENGQKVKAGDLVGLMGSTGRSTGPHLHFEVLVNDVKVDPYPFIRHNMRYARKLAREGKSPIASLQ